MRLDYATGSVQKWAIHENRIGVKNAPENEAQAKTNKRIETHHGILGFSMSTCVVTHFSIRRKKENMRFG